MCFRVGRVVHIIQANYKSKKEHIGMEKRQATMGLEAHFMT